MKRLELITWISTGLILIAYASVTLGVMETSSLTYIFLNLAGACGIATHSLKKKDYQPAVLNIIWGAVAIVALLSLLLS